MRDLATVCETFREHLASVVAAQLQSASFRTMLNQKKGLKGLSTLSITAFNDLKEISDKAAITTHDVDHIITHIVKRDPPAEFSTNHTAFSDALEKYRAATDLKAAADDLNKFRKIYQHIQNIFTKGHHRDGQTTDFLNEIKPALGVSYTQDRWFGKEKDLTNAEIRKTFGDTSRPQDQVRPSNKKP
jgi:hypothetical protein